MSQRLDVGGYSGSAQNFEWCFKQPAPKNEKAKQTNFGNHGFEFMFEGIGGHGP